jgi:hypothetical protein
MIWSSIFVLAAGAFACGKSSDAPSHEAGSAAPAVAPGSVVTSNPHDVLALITATNHPVLVGPFANLALTLELTNRDVGKIAPDLCKVTASIAAWCEYRSDDMPGVIFRVERIPMVESDVPDWPIGRLRITLPARGVRERLTAAWGSTREARGTALWFVPALHLRVAMHAASMHGDSADLVDLDYSGYISIDEFIGPAGAALFGFEQGTPLLGAAKPALQARFHSRLDGARLVLWPVDTADAKTVLVIGDPFGDELPPKIAGIQIDLKGVDHDALVRVLTAKFGHSHPDADGDEEFHLKPRVVLRGTSLVVGDVE